MSSASRAGARNMVWALAEMAHDNLAISMAQPAPCRADVKVRSGDLPLTAVSVPHAPLLTATFYQTAQSLERATATERRL